MELIAVEDVRRLLSVEEGIPWHQRSPLLIALGRALDHLPSIPAEPDQELRLRMQRTAREREAVRDLVQAGLLEDRQMQHMREQMAVWAPARIGGADDAPAGR